MSRAAEASAAQTSQEEEFNAFQPSKELYKNSNSRSSYVLIPTKAFQLARVLFMLGGCSAAVVAAFAGTLVLAYLLFITSVAPTADRFRQELFFDYSRTEAVASVSLLPDTVPSRQSLPQVTAASTRALVAGTKLDVTLELELPDDDVTNGGVFQVTGKLLSGDGREAAVISRPCVLPYQSPTVRRVKTWLASPLVLVGLWKERQTVRLDLFTAYTDKADPAFVFFKALLKPRPGDGSVPRVYKATVHVNLRLGWVGRVLFMGRPGSWVVLLLGLLGLCAMGGGSITLLGIIALWALSGSSSSKARRKHGDAGGDDVSEGTAASDADSAALREQDTDSDVDEAGPQGSGGGAVKSAWQQDLKLTSGGDHGNSVQGTVVAGIPVSSLDPNLHSRHRAGWEAQAD
ncbi:hypothetical protein WJX73_008876 [Symbiochloris irregularis]|uniref:Seipin n=1 Tax=Symbiochloris irregularis TaxID=706552 RepID=A0AAW1PKF7_9CHLO